MSLGIQIPRKLKDGRAISYYIRTIKPGMPQKISGACPEINSSYLNSQKYVEVNTIDHTYETFKSALAIQKNNKRNTHRRSLDSTMF